MRHNPSDGGWGPRACAELAKGFARWEEPVYAQLDLDEYEHSQPLIMDTWADLRRAFELGAQGGAVMLA
jgi:hypothetical protein